MMFVDPRYYRIFRQSPDVPWAIEVYDEVGKAIGLHVDRNANAVKGFESAADADLYARNVLKLQRLYSE